MRRVNRVLFILYNLNLTYWKKQRSLKFRYAQVYDCTHTQAHTHVFISYGIPEFHKITRYNVNIYLTDFCFVLK